MTKPTMWLCAQQRLRSAWAFAQSDQSLHCPHEETLGPQQPIECTGQMPRLSWVFTGHTCHFVGFVMRRLKNFSRLQLTFENLIIWSNLTQKLIEIYKTNCKIMKNYYIFENSGLWKIIPGFPARYRFSGSDPENSGHLGALAKSVFTDVHAMPARPIRVKKKILWKIIILALHFA